MNNNQVYFNIKDGKVTLKSRAPINLEDLLSVVQTGILSALKTVVSSAPEQQRPELTEHLYDMYNAAASHTLAEFAPELELRPNLTTRAILEAEDAILERELKQNGKTKKTSTTTTQSN